MRVSAETKENTRQAIMEAGHKLFSKRGFDQTTTREIAGECGIAAGTLFNYFSTKEALALALLRDGLTLTIRDAEKRLGAAETLEEELFILASAGLRRIAPQRGYLAPILETLLSPVSQGPPNSDADELRSQQLEAVIQRLAARGIDARASFVTLQMYWALYVGVLAFWSADESPKQEDTLALLDQSIRAFVASLTPRAQNVEVHHG